MYVFSLTFTATEPPRTPNPLFKRRFSLTTYTPLSGKTVQPSSKAAATTATTTSLSSTTLKAAASTSIDSLTTTVFVDGLENDEDTDQVAKSSIHTSRFNQINGRLHIDDDDDAEDTEAVVRGDVDEGSRHLVNNVKTITSLSSSSNKQKSEPPPQKYSKYNFDDVISRRMDSSGTFLKSSTGSSTTIATSSTTTQTPVIKKRKTEITLAFHLYSFY